MNKERKTRASGIGIIIFAALLIELLTLFQYHHLRKEAMKDVEQESGSELRIKTGIIENTLQSAESTMRENEWDLLRCLDIPDSIFAATGRLISVNPNIVGGSIAFIPYFYPEKGRLFEPYAYKSDSGIVLEQIGGPEHDYTQNPVFGQVLSEKSPVWSDPYKYGEDIVLDLTTYTYPLKDHKGDIAGACGIDIDLTWLVDSLNARHRYPSSFGMLLTRKAQPVSWHPRYQKTAEQVSTLIAENLQEDGAILPGHMYVIQFREGRKGRKASVYFTMMEKDPHWLVALVDYHSEIYAPVRRSWLQQMAIIFTGLLILLFMILRFAGKEKELRLATVERARIGGELDAARSIQMQMLPKQFPDHIYGFLRPAWEVGGDMFDFFTRDEKLFFCIGDVSGKGVPAAIVMAEIHSLFRVISETEENPAKIVRKLNRKLCKDNSSFMFTTFFMGILDLPSGKVCYCNAGHDHPFIVTTGAEEVPAVANMPLGVFSDMEFEEQSLTIRKGSTIFLYTDGLTEAKNEAHELFTLQRVKEVLGHCPTDPVGMISAMEEAVKGFVDGAEQSDDLTLLAIRY